MNWDSKQNMEIRDPLNSKRRTASLEHGYFKFGLKNMRLSPKVYRRGLEPKKINSFFV